MSWFGDKIAEAIGSVLPQNTDMLSSSMKRLTGMDYNELANRGKKEYPDTPAGSAHHRLASKLVTKALLDKIGWIPGVGEAAAYGIPQALGVGLEGSEALGRMAAGAPGAGLLEHFSMQDTSQDLGANVQGGREALEEYRRRRAPAFTGGKFP